MRFKILAATSVFIALAAKPSIYTILITNHIQLTLSTPILVALIYKMGTRAITPAVLINYISLFWSQLGTQILTLLLTTSLVFLDVQSNTTAYTLLNII